MLKIQIKGFPFFFIAEVFSPGPIVIKLQRSHVLICKGMLPAREHIGALNFGVALYCLRIRRIQRRQDLFGAFLTPIHIALHGQKIGVTGVPIGAETAPHHSPIVRRITAGVKKIRVVKIFLVNADIGVLSDLPAIADAFKSLIHVAAPGLPIEALRVLATFGDDIDDSIHDIGAPKRGARATDDFNTIDVFQQHILRFPIDTGEGRSINAPPINQHQEFVGKTIVESAGGNCPFIRVDAGDIEARSHA